MKKLISKLLAIIMVLQLVPITPTPVFANSFAYTNRDIQPKPTGSIYLNGMGEYYDVRYDSPNFGGAGQGRLYDLKVSAPNGYKGGALCFDQGLHALYQTTHNTPTEFTPVTFPEDAKSEDIKLFTRFFYYTTHALANPTVKEQIRKARGLTPDEEIWSNWDDGKRYAIGVLAQAVIWVNQKYRGQNLDPEELKTKYAEEMFAMIEHLNKLLKKDNKPQITNGGQPYTLAECRNTIDVIRKAKQDGQATYRDDEFNFYVARHQSDKLPVTEPTRNNNREYQRFLLAQYNPPTVQNKPVYIKFNKVDPNGPLAGAKFSVFTTNPKKPLSTKIFSVAGETVVGGQAYGMMLPDGKHLLELVETSTPSGHVLNSQPITFEVDTALNGTPQTAKLVKRDGNNIMNDIITKPQPGVPIVKIDKHTGEVLAGAKIKMTNTETGATYEFLTELNGPKFQCHNPAQPNYVEPGGYSVEEITPPQDYEPNTEVPKAKVIRFIEENGGTKVVGQAVFENAKKRKITLTKISSDNKPLPGALFRAYKNGTFIGDYETQADGTFSVENVGKGTYTFYETKAPVGYELPEMSIANSLIVFVDPDEGIDEYFLTSVNYAYKTLKIVKTYQDETPDAKPLQGATFEIIKDGAPLVGGPYVTDLAGEITIPNVGSGVYTVRETIPPQGYLMPNPPLNEQTIIVDVKSNVEPYVLNFTNFKAPKIKLVKTSADDNNGQKRLENAQFELYIQGLLFGTFMTDRNGEINIEYTDTQDANGRPVKGYGKFLNDHNIQNQSSWVVEFKEITPPDGYLLSVPSSQTNTIVKGQMLSEFNFVNSKYPQIVIKKYDSATNKPLAGTVFDIQIDATKVSGSHITDNNGEIRIDYAHYKAYLGNKINDKNITWTVTVTELTPTRSYFDAGVLTPKVQTHDLRMGQSLTHFVFKNEPHPDLRVFKKSSKRDTPLAGVTYSITSENGTLKRTATTDDTGWATFELVPEGTYTLREQDVPQGYIRSKKEYTIISQPSKDGHKQVLEVLFSNDDTPTLKIVKVNELDDCPLPGVKFNIKYRADDAPNATVDYGDFFTDENGVIEFTTKDVLKPGWYIITEVEPPKGFAYHKIDGKSKEIHLEGNRHYEHKVRNTPLSAAQIIKFDADTKAPLKDAHFTVRKANGEIIGEYKTDGNGIIIVSPLEEGHYEAVETKAPKGYELDNVPKKFEVKQGNMFIKIEAPNKKKPGLQILKIDEQTKAPIAGTEFEIKHSDGKLVGKFTTDKDGLINIPDLKSDTYIITETKASDGYLVNPEPKIVAIKENEFKNLTITNERGSGLLIFKIDSITKEPLQGVTFLLSDKYKKPIKELTSDNKGRIYVDDLKDGTYLIKEIKTLDNYKLDPSEKTLQIVKGKVTTIIWENTAKLGQLQVLKLSREDSPQTGLKADSPLENAVFNIYSFRSNRLIGQMISDKEGIASSKPLPIGQYKVKEVKAPKFFQKNEKELIMTIEYENQIVKETLYNSPAVQEVSINLKGVKEAVCKSQIDYILKDIENKSNMELENFYVRFKPHDTLRFDHMFTGEFSQNLIYDVVATTSLGRKIPVAGNLSTRKNNYIDLSANRMNLLPLEEIKEVTYQFGKVEKGFKATKDPRFFVTLTLPMPTGTQFVSKADAGGLYQDEWIIQDSTWKSKTWCSDNQNNPNAPRLPKTGY